MSNNDYFKNKASQFISLVSGLAEKKIHQIVDKSSELSSGIEKGVQEAYQTIIENISDWTDRFNEKDPGEFANGDLVISPVDIFIPSDVTLTSSSGANVNIKHFIKAGEVFEFKEELIPYLKTPLFEADTKAAIEWARLDELNKIKTFITDSQFGVGIAGNKILESYINQRLSDIRQQPEPEKA